MPPPFEITGHGRFTKITKVTKNTKNNYCFVIFVPW
jgi:hypothetical protein